MAVDTNTTAPRHSVAEISSAIQAMMLRLSGGKAFDAALAENLAGNIHVAVNDPRNGLDNLVGNPAFERLVSEKAPTLAQSVNDPEAKLAAAKAEQARANISGAPLSEAARALLGLGNHARVAAANANRGIDSGSGSGARYDSMAAHNDWGSPAGMAQMRDLAIRSGVGWAANNPEILRLGPSAIHILAETHLRKEVFQEMTKAGLSTKGSVGVAAMAKAAGRDANEVGASVAKSLDTLADPAITKAVDERAKLQVPGENETAEQRIAREAKIGAAEGRLRESVQNHIGKKPGHAATGKKLMDDLGVKLENNNLQKKATGEKLAAKGSAFDDFDSAQPATSTPASSEKTTGDKKQEPKAPGTSQPSTPAAHSKPKARPVGHNLS